MSDHQHYRKQIYLKAFELTHNEMQKFTTNANKTINASCSQSETALKHFDKTFPDPDLQKQNEVVVFFNKMQELLPGIATENLFSLVNELYESKKQLTEFKSLFEKGSDIIHEISILKKKAYMIDSLEKFYELMPDSNGNYFANPIPGIPALMEPNPLPSDFTGWVKDSGDNKFMAYSKLGKLIFGFDANGKWVQSPSGPMLNRKEIKAPVNEFLKALKQEAINRTLISSTDEVNWDGSRLFHLKTDLGPFEILDSEGNWLPF